MKKSLFRHLIAICILCLEFGLCRYIFFDIHGMRQWPFVLLFLGVIVLFISFVFRAKYIPIFISVGYLIAFFACIIFQTDGADPGGGKTNSLWIIWTIVFVCVIMVSVLCEIFIRIRNKKKIRDEVLNSK